MNRPIWAVLLLVSVILTLAGCGSDSNSDPAAKKDQPPGTDTPAGAGSGGSQPTVHLLSENVIKRSSMEGKWILLFYERMSGMEVPAALLDISKSANGPKLKVIVKGFGSMLQNPRIKQAVATENSLHLALEMTVQTMAQGRTPTHDTKMLDVLIDLRDGVARGTAQFEPMDSFAVMLVPSELDNIQALQPQQLPESVELQGGKDTTPEQALDQLVAFVQWHPNSPMTLEMYPFIFRGAVTRQMPEATVAAEADKYAALADSWASRMGFKARIDVAAGLIPAGYLPQVALKQIDIESGQADGRADPGLEILAAGDEANSHFQPGHAPDSHRDAGGKDQSGRRPSRSAEDAALQSDRRLRHGKVRGRAGKEAGSAARLRRGSGAAPVRRDLGRDGEK